MSSKTSKRASASAAAEGSAVGRDKGAKRIAFLEKQVLEAERTLEVLVAGGFVTAEKVKEARDLVQSLLWR